MKRRIFMLILAVCLLCPLFGACGSDDKELKLSPAVEKAVRSAIGDAVFEGELTPELLAGIVMLDVAFDPQESDGSFSEHTAEDLQGLEYLTALRSLRISYYNGTSLAFLEDVPKLRLLELTWDGGDMLTGPTPDLTALQNLSNLAYLQISGYRVGDLQEIGKLGSLEHLALNGHGCSFTDLKPLAKLQQLRSLSLTRWSDKASVTMLTDLLPIAALGQLEYLKLDSFAGDIAALQNLPIRALSLSHSQIDDFSVLPQTVEALMIGALKDVNDQVHTLLEQDDINFTDDDVKHLRNLPELRYLQVYQRLATSVELDSLTVHRYYYAYTTDGAPMLTDAGSTLLRNDKGWNDDVYTEIYRDYLAETPR